MSQYRDFKGSKYDANLDVAEIAKRIRADIKAAIASKHLPTGAYSVKIRRFAGGCAIDVRIADVPFVVLNRERVVADATKPHEFNGLPIHTEAASEILARTKAIVQAYNHDRSDVQTDYFDVKFYGDVSFAWEFEKAQREAMLAQVAAA